MDRDRFVDRSGRPQGQCAADRLCVALIDRKMQHANRPNRSTQAPLGEHAAQQQGSQDRQVRQGDRLDASVELSAEERRRREDAVRFADASIALEGFKVGAAEHAHADRFIAGQIELNEFLLGPTDPAPDGEPSGVAPS